MGGVEIWKIKYFGSSIGHLWSILYCKCSRLVRSDLADARWAVLYNLRGSQIPKEGSMKDQGPANHRGACDANRRDASRRGCPKDQWIQESGRGGGALLLQKWTAPLVDPKRPRYDGARVRIADGPLLHLLGARGICGSVACAEGAQPRVRLLSPSISSSPSHSHNLNSLCHSKLSAPQDEFKTLKLLI